MFFSSSQRYILHDWVVCNEISVLAVRNTGQPNYSRARQRSHTEENITNLPGPSCSSAHELFLPVQEEEKLGWLPLVACNYPLPTNLLLTHFTEKTDPPCPCAARWYCKCVLDCRLQLANRIWTRGFSRAFAKTRFSSACLHLLASFSCML